MSYDPGRYLGEITSHGFEAVGTKKTPALKILFKVLAKRSPEGEYEEVDPQYERNVTCWFTDKGAKHAVKNLRKYCGWEGSDLGELNGDCLVGSQIEVVNKPDNDYDNFEFPFEGGSSKHAPEKNEKVAKHLRNKFNNLVRDTRPKSN